MFEDHMKCCRKKRRKKRRLVGPAIIVTGFQKHYTLVLKSLQPDSGTKWEREPVSKATTKASDNLSEA